MTPTTTTNWGEPLVLIKSKLNRVLEDTVVSVLGSSRREIAWAFDAVKASTQEDARKVLAANKTSRFVVVGSRSAKAFGVADLNPFEKKMVRVDGVKDDDGLLRSYWIPVAYWPSPKEKGLSLEHYRNAGRRLLSSWGRPLALYPRGPINTDYKLSSDPRGDEDRDRSEEETPYWIQPNESFDAGAFVRNLWRARILSESPGAFGGRVLRGEVPTITSLRNVAASLDVEEDYLLRKAEHEDPIVVGDGLRKDVFEEAVQAKSVSDVADALGVTGSTIYAYLSGARAPMPWSSVQVARATGVEVDELFEDSWIV